MKPKDIEHLFNDVVASCIPLALFLVSVEANF